MEFPSRLLSFRRESFVVPLVTASFLTRLFAFYSVSRAPNPHVDDCCLPFDHCIPRLFAPTPVMTSVRRGRSQSGSYKWTSGTLRIFALSLATPLPCHEIVDVYQNPPGYLLPLSFCIPLDRIYHSDHVCSPRCLT